MRLSRFGNLIILVISGDQLPREGIGRLHEVLPDCEIKVVGKRGSLSSDTRVEVCPDSSLLNLESMRSRR